MFHGSYPAVSPRRNIRRLSPKFVSLILVALIGAVTFTVVGPAGAALEPEGSGCTVARSGDTARINYNPGIGDSLNLRGSDGWIATLDVDRNLFTHSPAVDEYTLIRRDRGVRETVVCTERSFPTPDEPIVVTGPGCVIERFGEPSPFGGVNSDSATIHYAPGIGASLNIRTSSGAWLATLDINGSEFDTEPGRTGYEIVRRNGDTSEFYTCTEVGEPVNNTPTPTGPPPVEPFPVATEPIVVTGPGCVIERFGEPSPFSASSDSVTIHYAPGIGETVNLRVSPGPWLATLDVNGSEFDDEPGRSGYNIIRRNGTTAAVYECTDFGDPINNTPVSITG